MAINEVEQAACYRIATFTAAIGGMGGW